MKNEPEELDVFKEVKSRKKTVSLQHNWHIKEKTIYRISELSPHRHLIEDEKN